MRRARCPWSTGRCRSATASSSTEGSTTSLDIAVEAGLLEPDSGDELIFQTSIMNYTSRVEIARHGFQSVTLKLGNDYPRFERICARHGIEISASRVRAVVKHFEAERESTGAWRKILEQTTSTLLRQSAQ